MMRTAVFIAAAAFVLTSCCSGSSYDLVAVPTSYRPNDTIPLPTVIERYWSLQRCEEAAARMKINALITAWCV
jgi:hypothetical protein